MMGQMALVQKETAILYQKKTNSMILQPNGIFVVEVDLPQLQFHLIQFVLNYLILSCCLEKEVLVKSLMEGMFKLDGFCNFFHFYFFSIFQDNLPFLIVFSFDFQSWDDEDGVDSGSYRNAVSGTLPDGSYDSNTEIQYCTYGPSFCIFLQINLIFHF